MSLNNAEKCKNYRERQEEASLKLKNPPLTSAQRSRMYRLRKKKLTQGIKSCVNEVLYISSTAKSRMTSEPSLQPVTTRKHPILDFDNEKRLVKHILKLGDAGFPPNRQAIRMLAYQFAEKLRLKHNFDHENKMAGGAWFKSFIERNPELSIRQAEGLSVARAKGLSREEVNDFYDLLMKVLTENDLLDKPEKINNMDESGIQLNNKPGKVIAKKGAKVVNSVTSAEKVFKMSEDITKKNAQYCKNYYIRKKMANKGAVKLKKTNSEYCRTSRQRKKVIAQELQSENEDIHTPSTSRIQVTYEPQPVTTDEECKMLNQDQELLQPDAPTVNGNYSDRLIMDHSTGTYDTMTNETEDVKEETDIQANELIEKNNITDFRNENVRNRKTSELDKFKRRMIRAIARLMYTEHRAQADIWEDLKNETGCDCELLWSRMRALTIKKLLRLFTAEDKIKNINKIVQLSVTDWLLYDLVLVHEKVDVIGQELNDKEEPAFLRDLFNLVEEFNIESAVGEDLVKKWFEATAKYNNTGKRQSSPMLLQKRWYQLKERSRSNFYNFWFEYRGDSKKLERANEFKPSDLQLDIVKRYKEIVTKPFLNWEVLIKEGRVALPEDFERLRMARNKIKISENEPDIEVIEQHVETIDLEETNDSNDTVNKDTYNNENDFNIDIVKVESLAEQDDDVSVLESVYIPLEKTEFSERNNDECDVDVEAIKCPDDNDLEIIESDLGQMVPKIASVTSTAYIESTKDGTYEELPSKDIIDIEDCETRSKSSEAVNVILEQIVKNVVENKIITNVDKKNATTSKGKVPNLEKDIDILRSNASTDLDIKELKNTDMPGNDKSSTEIEEKYDIGFDDFSNNLDFIDDGIEFEDDGIEYMDEDFVVDHKVKSEIKLENIEATNEEEPKIDLKLLLTPVVYTKKLDDMDVFRFIDYNTVKDDRVLQNAARESKPVDNKSVNMKTMFQEHNQDDSCSLESDSGDVISDDGVAITSWLFRKPKVNNYNPIQLCKNPDFNTRLKRLAAAFYTSQRNRLLLKQCKPLTVDLHKTFESKLIDNTLFLNKTKNDLDIENTVNEISVISCKTEPIEPSTDNDQLTQSSTIAADQQISIEQPPEIHTERNKVINLPDIVQIRRVNQGLLVAEVSPIQVVNPVNEINTRPLKNLLNTVIEPGTTHMNSTVTDEEVIKSPNFSQLLLDTDKIVAVSESEHSKLTDTINVDIEQSETMSQQVNNYKRHTRESLLKQPITRTKTKTGTKKYMQLSWLPKPQTIRTDATDCLLAADTVERILSLCKDDYIPQNLKVYKPKRKKKAGVTDKKTTENQVSAVGKKKTIKEKNNKKETRIPKKSKCRVSIFAQTTNIKNVCCWSRQKVENFTKLNTGKHYCLHNKCVCCCKADLEAKIFAIEQQRLQSELIILSDDESIAITSAKTHLPISQVTIGTNTDYDKDFEDQFAANLNMFKDNANQVHTPIISLPLNGLPQTFSTESGSQTITPNRVVEPLPPTILDNKIPSVTSTHKNKPKVPISLGRNKILLCSFKPTTGTASVKKIKNFNQNGHPEQVLPKGCNLVLLPNRELALSIDPGVELDAIQLSKLPSLIAEVQKQINVFATENILESQKVKSDEETVIHLSDDENLSMKDKAENNSNVNVASTTNASPRTEHLDSNNSNTMTEVGATTKEKKLIPSIDLNSLSSPKELCNIPGLATTTNSTIIDSEDVFVESSMNERTSKDNIKISEVVDNSTNNTEDALAVNKKTILSDLMEMSGISTDDISVSNNDENFATNDDSGSNNDGNYANNDGNVSNNDEKLASNDGSVCHNDSAATNNKSISLLQQVLLQADSCTSDLQREYNNITRSIGVNPIMDNVFVRAALLRCPELNIISSFPELKYAYENGAQFFKMDVVNGIIVPINVCIKQDLEEVRKQLRKKVSKVPKSIIDLTEDNEIATYSTNFRPIAPKMFIQEPNESCEETSEGMIQPDKNNSPVKPIKMFKAVHPSILRYSGRSLLVRPVKNSTELQNKIVRLTKHKRKQGLCVKNIDVDEYNNFKPRDNTTNKIDSDAESDEEPLAKKAKRLKDHLDRGTKNKNIDHSLYMDDDMNTKGTATMDINHKLPPRLEPIVFDDNTGQSSDDDCILGV